MKSLFILLTALFSFFAKSSYAGTTDVTPVVLRSFQQSFGKQNNVEWSVMDQLYKANFTFNGQNVTAYFNTDGEMVAVTHPIVSTELPITLQARLKKDYTNYWITDLFEVVKSDVEYYITLENADTKVILKASPATGWSVYQKSAK